MHLISIIVPVYNVEKYLRECVDSICGQTGIKSEIILIDDGSTDGSGKICDEYAQRYSNVKAVHKENGGLVSARNAGLEVMTGEYVGFIDSDDYIEKDMYAVLLQALLRTGSDIACCGWNRVVDDGNGFQIQKEGGIEKETVFTSLEAINSLFLNSGMTYSACDKLFKAELFKNNRFPSENLPSEDIPCIYQIIKSVRQIVHTGMKKYYYRVVMTSITRKEFTSRNMSTVYYMNQIYEEVLKEMPEQKEQALFALVQCIDSTYARLIRDKKQKLCKKEKQQLEALLRKSWLRIIKNKYLVRNAKTVSLFMAFKLYPFFHKVTGKE